MEVHSKQYSVDNQLKKFLPRKKLSVDISSSASQVIHEEGEIRYIGGDTVVMGSTWGRDRFFLSLGEMRGSTPGRLRTISAPRDRWNAAVSCQYGCVDQIDHLNQSHSEPKRWLRSAFSSCMLFGAA